MHSVGLRMGEFSSLLTGVFDFRGEDFQSDSKYFGLHLSEAYLFGHVRSKRDGRNFHITRPVISAPSSGLSLSTEKRPGALLFDERSAEFLRGGMFRRFVGDKGELVLKGGSAFWSGASPLEVEAHFGDDFTWVDSGKMTLRGRRLGPATQTYVPTRQGRFGTGVGHTAVYYQAEGELFGEPVSGCFTLEQIFCEPGQLLTDSVIQKRLVGSWNAFSTVFEDGSVQYGNVGYGAGSWRFATIMDNDRLILAKVESIEVETDAQGVGKRLVYHLDNGETWESVVTMVLLDMLERARAVGSTVQAHKGYLQRVGETRQRRDWYCIQQWVPERLVAQPVEDAGAKLPHEF